jgi:Ni/Co efflux regulator RcnB
MAMKKATISIITALGAVGLAISSPAAAQDGRYRDSDGDGRSDYREWNRDRDRDGRADQWDRRDNRRDGYRNRYRWRHYGGRNGYDGYRGSWRTGQRYPYYRDSRYMIRDYRAYDLPPPYRGYRYYRDNNGDVVMAALATGIIGLVLGQALSDNDRYDRRYDGRGW